MGAASWNGMGEAVCATMCSGREDTSAIFSGVYTIYSPSSDLHANKYVIVGRDSALKVQSKSMAEFYEHVNCHFVIEPFHAGDGQLRYLISGIEGGLHPGKYLSADSNSGLKLCTPMDENPRHLVNIQFAIEPSRLYDGQQTYLVGNLDNDQTQSYMKIFEDGHLSMVHEMDAGGAAQDNGYHFCIEPYPHPLGAPSKSGNDTALRIVRNSRAMASAVSTEWDMLDCDWSGVNDRDPLCTLLGTTDSTQAVVAMVAIAESTQDLMANGSSLNEAQFPTKVFGDLHGQFRDLLLLLHNFGFPSPRGPHYVFNGDFVDRGKHQLETVTLIYALKLAFPDKVWLNRGNHEDREQNIHQGKTGFFHECKDRLGEQDGDRVFNAFGKSFEYLPFGAIIGGTALVVHGGIGHGQWDIQYLANVRRPIDHDSLAKDAILYNILWSDPIDDDEPDCFGVHDSPRDNHTHLIAAFGADVSETFCIRNNLGLIIRSHEARVGGDGYEIMHGDRLVRVFSARDYNNGNMKNDGSVLCFAMMPHGLVVTPQVLNSLTKDRWTSDSWWYG